MKTKSVIAVSVIAALGLAQDAFASSRLSGFGQVVAGKIVNEGENYPNRLYDHEMDFSEESLIGIQVEAPVNDRITATAQVIAKGDSDFEASLAWAYATAELSDHFEMKIGRQRTPFFRYSDFRDVGYAYTWLRPPVAMYFLPFDNMDAVTISHRTQIGRWHSRTTGFIGSYSATVPITNVPTQTELRNFMGISWEGNYDDWLTLRAAYSAADASASQTALTQLLNTMRNLGLAGAANLIAAEDDRGTFLGYGFEIDRNEWIFQGEYSHVGIEDSIFTYSNNWYVSLARRVGAFTPYVVYGERNAGLELEAVNLIPAGHPLKPIVANVLGSREFDDTYVSAGLRWDFARNVALKADFSRHRSDVAGRNGGELASVGIAFIF